MNLSSYVPYVCCAGPFAALLGGFYPASVAVGACTRAASARYVLLSQRPVPITTDGIVPIVAIPVAVVAVVSIAVVAVGYLVVYQGSVLVFTELADQLGLQS